MRVPNPCLVLLLGSLAACQSGRGQSDVAPPQSEDHALLGAEAPDFDLPSIGSNAESPRFRLRDHRGKLVVVDFWATWCAPCKESFPAYEQTARERSGDTVFVGVSVDEDPSGIPAFIEQTGVTFPVTWDEGQTVSAAYQPPTMPTSFVIDRNGIVRHVHAGFRQGDEERLRAVLDSL